MLGNGHRAVLFSRSPRRSIAGSVAADVKIAFIDPLSGGGAATGILAQKTHQFYIDAINAAGGINGEKIELLSFDNKVNPQESLIQLKKALDEGARYVVQGNGSSVALAITDAVQKHNERNPGKEVLFLNYAAVDPALTNEKCNFWHFRFDADADMKMAAMTDVIAKDQKIKRVYLINQDYSFGKAVAAAATKMLAEKRPDIKIVGDELHPLQKVQDFSPYVAKIKASGADTVITGNWSNDMVLLIKAGQGRGAQGQLGNVLRRQPGRRDGDRRGRRRHAEAGLRMAQERHAGARRDRGRLRQALSRQGKRVRVLARQDDVGDVRRSGEEGAVERSGEGGEGARRHEDADLARRGRDARRQSPDPAAALRLHAGRRARSTTPKAPASAGRPTPRSTARRPRCRRRARWSGRADAARLNADRGLRLRRDAARPVAADRARVTHRIALARCSSSRPSRC